MVRQFKIEEIRKKNPCSQNSGKREKALPLIPLVFGTYIPNGNLEIVNVFYHVNGKSPMQQVTWSQYV